MAWTVAAAAILLVVSCSFVSSGILPGPPSSFHTKGLKKGRAPESQLNLPFRSGPRGSFSVRPRECSVVRRTTRYEKVKASLACKKGTSVAFPMPQIPARQRAQAIKALKANGWELCYKVVPVPVHRFQRIPVCCPGTLPTPDGRCICNKNTMALAAAAAAMAAQNRQQSQMPRPVPMPMPFPMPMARPFPMPRPLPGPLTMPMGGRRPRPGQLVKGRTTGQQSKNGGLRVNERPGPAYRRPNRPPPGPAAIIMKAPRPYRAMLSQTSTKSMTPGSLMHQIMLNLRRGIPTYKKQPRGKPTAPSNNNYKRVTITTSRRQPVNQLMNRRLPPRLQNPRAQVQTPAKGQAGGQSARQTEFARYMASMVYKTMLQEAQEKFLRDEIERQMRIRQQIEMVIRAQRQMLMKQQQQKQHALGQGQGQESPILQKPPTRQWSNQANAPNPIPGPLFQDFPENPNYYPEVTSSPRSSFPEIQSAPEVVTEMPAIVTEQLIEDPGLSTAMTEDTLVASDNTGGNLGDTPQTAEPSFPSSPPVPLASQEGSLQQSIQELSQKKEEVKQLLEGCLRQVGITQTAHDILETGRDALSHMKPVCMKSELLGPCLMSQAQTQLSRDPLGQRMMQAAMMSLAFMCRRLIETGELQRPSPPSPINEAMTPQPVFPNPAPSVTKTEVTEGTVDLSEGQKNSEQSPPRPPPVQSASLASSSDVQEPAEPQKTSKPLEDPLLSQQQMGARPGQIDEDELLVEEASFPLWMILVMVGSCAALLLLCCLTVCLLLRCRRKKKEVELDREPEKLPPPVDNVYAASPCVPPPSYLTTPVKQTLGGDEDLDKQEFKIPEDEEKESKKTEEKEENKEKEEKKEEKE